MLSCAIRLMSANYYVQDGGGLQGKRGCRGDGVGWVGMGWGLGKEKFIWKTLALVCGVSRTLV